MNSLLHTEFSGQNFTRGRRRRSGGRQLRPRRARATERGSRAPSASYLVMGHALRLGDELSAAHPAVALGEQLLVDVGGFHLFTAETRDKRQNQSQEAGRTGCVR